MALGRRSKRLGRARRGHDAEQQYQCKDDRRGSQLPGDHDHSFARARRSLVDSRLAVRTWARVTCVECFDYSTTQMVETRLADDRPNRRARRPAFRRANNLFTVEAISPSVAPQAALATSIPTGSILDSEDGVISGEIRQTSSSRPEANNPYRAPTTSKSLRGCGKRRATTTLTHTAATSKVTTAGAHDSAKRSKTSNTLNTGLIRPNN